MAANTLTGLNAHLTLQTKNGFITIADLKDISFEDNFTQEALMAIGTLGAIEVPTLSFAGSGTATIFKRYDSEALRAMGISQNASVQQIYDNIVGKSVEDGLVINISQTIKSGTNADGTAITERKLIEVVKYVHIGSRSTNISQGAISMESISFLYTDPRVNPQ